MKTIYILLTRSDTYISRIINFLTNDRYTHVSISFDESLQPLYSFSRKYVSSPLPAGLRMEPLHKGFFKRYNQIPCALYALEVSEDIYTTALQKVEQMIAEASKYRFNVLGLVLCKLGISYHRKNCFFCSEFVSEVLERSHALSLPKDTSLMRPNDYTKISVLSCKFEGTLNNLTERFAYSKSVPASVLSCGSINIT